MPIDLMDIQGNVLRGVRAAFARHFLLGITDAAAASRAILSLTPGADDADGIGGDDDGLRISTAAEWEDRPPYFMTLGITHAGLTVLGLPSGMLQAFPEAFRGGPTRVNANSGVPLSIELGDVAPDPADASRKTLSANDVGHPSQWEFGGPGSAATHIVLSLYTDPQEADDTLEAYTRRLHTLFAAHALTVLSIHDAAGLPAGKVHFGYRDGVAQPRVDGVPGRVREDMQPASSPGEFLLGKDYRNQYQGNFLRDIPSALGDNGTFGAFRKVEQNVRAFESFIEEAGRRANMDKELIAAKLMGRWRNGAPLTLAPDAESSEIGEAALNRYDYAPTKANPSIYADDEGLRCPIGAHARRMNPRGALVMGRPYARRIIRRGMPFGPLFDPSKPYDGIARGLIGYFVCGDLESQFEFLLAVWGNKDFSTTGIRGTVDPIVGLQPSYGGSHTIRTDDGRDPITLTGLPRWITTRGTEYCFLPGISALRWIGERRWEAAHATVASTATTAV